VSLPLFSSMFSTRTRLGSVTAPGMFAMPILLKNETHRIAPEDEALL
jgi:hypothetical protein